MAQKYFLFRKGLETPLKIWGMYTTYFYIFFTSIGAAILFLVTRFMSVLQDYTKEAIFKFFLQIVYTFIFVLVVWGFLKYKSERRGFHFKRDVYNISNRHILKITK